MEVLMEWEKTITSYHVKCDFVSEYYVIRGMLDFLKGIKWLKHIDAERYHKRLSNMRVNKLKNAISWRIAERWFRLKYHAQSSK